MGNKKRAEEEAKKWGWSKEVLELLGGLEQDPRNVIGWVEELGSSDEGLWVLSWELAFILRDKCYYEVLGKGRLV